ncbi:hypothetical protein DFJ74DRAFT_697952 [Hyaloraphidium curvatum]|nr:hypothetical protein DFJ74DRAFT_697952 [Hyaloraphidium curvatum]
MTCDAAMDCKLWDLTTGKMLRRWRKWHSRPISKCSFFPVLQGLGDMADYAVSCSTDHSLKVWRAVMEDKARRDDDETALDSGLEDTDDAKRVHANEPFGGFDFAPAEDNAAEVARGHGKALLIAGLSYALKIYDALELNLLKSVRLPSLKESKTHISAIACHPSGPRTHVLVSAGCSVLLVECWSGGIVLNFNSRHVDPRSNIVGSFSPCAKYVYATEVGPRGADDGPSTKAGLHFWKAESATEVEVDLGAEAGEVASAAWIGSRSNPKERILVAAGTDGLLRVYR